MTRQDKLKLERELESTGLPYTIQRGGRHIKVKLCGHLVGVLPGSKTVTDGRSMLNVISQIRNKAKELSCENA